MTQQSNHLAKVGGKLAGVGAVFLPLTVITGLWGMNCKVPFQYEVKGGWLEDGIWGFVIVLVIMVISSLATWMFVERQGWIEHLGGERREGRHLISLPIIDCALYLKILLMR